MASPLVPFVGTAGWGLPKALADRFPAVGTHLERYAARLNAAEINSSFYRPHRRSTYERWAGSVPEDFRFSVKLPRSVTHEKRLCDCDADLERFAAEIEGLGAKLGVVLVQLAPSLAFDAGNVEAFLARLAGVTRAGIALEPRHRSWFTAAGERLLSENRIARVAADPAVVQAAAEPGGWDGLVYYRLHGSPRMYYSDYDAQALAEMARRLESDCVSGAPTWCIFDNTAAGAATANALAMARVAARE